MAVYLIPQFLAIYSPREQTINRTCESHAKSVIAAVQEETTHRNLVQWLETSAKRSGNLRPAFTPTRAIPASRLADYWTPTASFYSTQVPLAGSASAGTRLQNATLIQGSLRTLSTIYNRNSGVRCAFGSYDPLTSTANMPLPAVLAQHNTAANPVVVTINIEPYRVSTNASLCSTSINLFPIPSSNSTSEMSNAYITRSGNTDVSSVEPSTYTGDPNPAPTYNTAAMNAYRIVNSANGDRDIGFRLRTQVSYVINGATKTCQVSQNFEYPIDNTPPAVPDDVVIQRNGSLQDAALAAAQDNCTAPVNEQVNLRIGYLTAPERGTVLLCRDLSYIQNRQANYSTTLFNNPDGPQTTTTNYSGACISVAGMSGRPAASNGLNPFPRQKSILAPAADPEISNPSTRLLWDQGYRSFAQRENFWQPCDQLKLCGATAVSTLNNEFSMNLQYSSVPVGCVINFEVVGVDTAGNRSNTAAPLPIAPALPRSGTLPSFTIEDGSLNFNGSVGFGSIVFPPTCGNSTSCTRTNGTCSSISKANYLQYYFGGSDSGYYVPRRGVFCKPTRNTSDDGNSIAARAEPNATLHWSSNTVGGNNWRTLFPNGYYTCRSAFGGTGGTGGSGSNGCCWDPPGSTTCTPFN